MIDPKRRALIGAMIRDACRLDVLALKPGNVSVHASGHGMAAQDFLRSGAVAAPALVIPECTLGEHVFRAVSASVDAAKCNTNLGIVLLAGPLVHAALDAPTDSTLHSRVVSVLRRSTREDTADVYAAIRYAAPAGLGRATQQDVENEPTMALPAAMSLASIRDRIAFQFSNDFADIFEVGIPLLRDYRERWNSLVWPMVGLYLDLLVRYPDTHIVRKYGEKKACEVQRRAQPLESSFKACENPAALTNELLKFDRSLKNEGVNPGTSADLTVASVLAMLLQHA